MDDKELDRMFLGRYRSADEKAGRKTTPEKRLTPRERGRAATRGRHESIAGLYRAFASDVSATLTDSPEKTRCLDHLYSSMMQAHGAIRGGKGIDPPEVDA